MTTSPTPACRWQLALCTSLALAMTAGCQRQEPAATEPPAPATPAAAPERAPAVAITGDEVPAGVLRAYVWECADGQRLVMRNLFRERAIAIDFHDGTRRLDQTSSASGARYADAVTVFWTKGSAATLERQGAPAVSCEERRAESLREDARARGVTLRALGNEPGWVLEVGPGSHLSWTTNFGEVRYDFDQARQSATDGAVTYVAQQGTNALKATVRNAACVDDGGIEFDHAVTVEFEGQQFRGCGSRLNPN
jgi:putative lipoprotein